MKKEVIIFLCLFIVLPIGFIAAQDKMSYPDYQDLIRCYHLLISNRNDETKINYFNSFPGSYTEFVRFFGYNDNADGVVYGNLYEESLEYISEFFLLNKEINHNDFSNKIIGICINGKWEADAVNYFQTHVRNIVTSSHQDCCCDNVDKFNCYNDTLQNAFLSCLTHYEEKHILSFWRFYFDRPAEIPINKELYSLTRHVLLKYPKLDKLLQDIYSSQNDSLLEDADGNLAQMIDCDRNKMRFHRWNDFDRLTFSLGHDFCGYYGYDADGIRTYKLTGTCTINQQNGGDIRAQAIFEDMVLYPSPFVVVTPRGYTNHYYAGSERIASRIGNECWVDNPFGTYEKPSPEWTALEEFQNLPNESYPFGRTDDWSDVVKNSTPIQDFLEKVQYPCPPVDLKQLNVLYSEDMLHDVMDCKTPTTNIVPVYYYHPDHLGSTSWVTDEVGNDFHFLAYMPYGEPFMDKHPAPYDTRYGQDFARYQFTGKERDAETGYDYIEQRYYWWPGGFWLRPDPLLDKYLNLSPYAYCNGNPLKYVDPDGRVWESFWDAAWILWDGASFLYNTIVGNDQEAAMDAACFTADCATLLVPFAPALSGPARASAKLAPKVAEATPKVAKAIDKIITATKNTYRQALQKATGKMGKGFEAHHTLPQKYRDRFEKLGINIDEPGNVVWRKTEDHKAGNAEHGRAWDKFFKDNPSPTKEQVLEFRDQTEQKVWGNIGDSPLQ